MISCFGYLRVSTVRQGEGVSLQEQKAAIEECAERRNLLITEWFEEKETAAKTGRPVFNHMIKRLRQGHAAGLIVHKLDRSARNLRDWTAVSELMDNDVEFHIATEPIVFATRGGRMTADFLAVIAADFSRNQREETKKGLNGRLKQGLYPFKAPLGYLDMGRGQPKAICPLKGALVRELFELYLSGQHSMRSLHKEMRELGLRGHGGKPVSMHGIEKILSNTFYHGLITIERTGETYDGQHEPILTEQEFKQIQRIKKGRCGQKVTKHDHRFQGVFRCGGCGGAMVPELQRGHVYYRCKDMTCAVKCVREDRIDSHVRRAVQQMEWSTDIIRVMKARWKEDANFASLEKERRSLTARIEAVETKIARATDLLIEGTLERPEYDAKKSELAFEVSLLRGQFDDLPDPKVLRSKRNHYLELFSQLSNTYQAATNAERRALLKNLFAERLLFADRVHLVEVAIPAFIAVQPPKKRGQRHPV